VTTTQVLTPAHVWYIRTARRNSYGLVGPVADAHTYRIAADGSLDATPPSGPSIVQLKAYGQGDFLIEAQYIPGTDDLDVRADAWLVYYRADGTDPVPSIDTPLEFAFDIGGPQQLRYAVDGNYMAGTPFRVIVRTRRSGTPDVDSENVDVYSATSEWCGPRRPVGLAAIGNKLAIYQTPASFSETITWIDEPNNIYWQMLPGETRLWADTVLVWNIKYDSRDTVLNALYHTFAHEATAVSVAATAEIVDVLSWTVGDERLGVNVNGTRRMVVDVTNTWFYNAYVDQASTPTDSCAEAPASRRYDGTVLQVWDRSTQEYVTVGELRSDGGLWLRVPMLMCATQAECL